MTETQAAPAAQPTVTVHEILDAAERLTSSIATEFHKDAAVSAQFMAGEWQKFKAVVVAARNAHGPSPVPASVDPPVALSSDKELAQAARIKELEDQIAILGKGMPGLISNPGGSESSNTTAPKGLV